jgi:hypothetical protein
MSELPQQASFFIRTNEHRVAEISRDRYHSDAEFYRQLWLSKFGVDIFKSVEISPFDIKDQVIVNRMKTMKTNNRS